MKATAPAPTGHILPGCTVDHSNPFTGCEAHSGTVATTYDGDIAVNGYGFADETGTSHEFELYLTKYAEGVALDMAGAERLRDLLDERIGAAGGRVLRPACTSRRRIVRNTRRPSRNH